MFLGEKLLEWILLAFGSAMCLGNLAALLNPPKNRDEQDLRKMGGLIQILPVSYTMIFIGSLALVGFPFLTGFYSKDVVFEIALATPTFIGNFAH